MNTLDYILAIPLLYFAFQGFKNGFIKEVLSIVGVVLAVFFSFLYMDPFSEVLRPLFGRNTPFLNLFAGAIIFLGVLAAVHLATEIIRQILKALHLNIFNRIAGILFGLMKGGIIVSVILIMLSSFHYPRKATRNQSALYPVVIEVAPKTYNAFSTIIPGVKEFAETVDESFTTEEILKKIPK